MKVHVLAGLLLTSAGVASLQADAVAQRRAVTAPNASCATFKALVKKTYNFDAARLSDRQKMAKEKVLNQFWKVVKSQKKQYLPCLRAEVQNRNANKFFRYDGVNLLNSLDPSADSKKLMIEVYLATDLDIVGPERWLVTLARLGYEGFDISRAASRWLSDPKAHYTQGMHGDFNVSDFVGALFLFGSMSEATATPALVKIVSNPRHPKREAALSILMDQATPAAFKAINALDAGTFTPRFQEIIEQYRSYPPRILPRDKPLTTRQEFLQAFQDLVQGKSARFEALSKVEDGERDVVAVMKPEDLPLLRKVRRLYIAGANPHAISYYNSFTDIIMTMVRKAAPPANAPTR